MDPLNLVSFVEQLRAGMIGRLSMTNDEATFLMCSIIPGDVYCETGTLFAGSAILAARTADRVYTVDSMMGAFWAQSGASAEAIITNLARFRVAHKVNFIKAKSYPWPLPDEIKPDVFLIDGGHSFGDAAKDWITASAITGRFILVHDNHRSKQYPGVRQMVDQVANKDPAWKFADQVGTLARFVRNDNN